MKNNKAHKIQKIADPKVGIKVARDFKNDFKEFISRGNIMDMAVGVIIGSAFGKIVSSLVSDLIMPLIGTLMGGLNFSNLSITVGEANIKYGSFIQTIIDFLIIAMAIFVFVKVLTNIQQHMTKEPEKVEEEIKIEDKQLTVLKEIRDSLKK